MIVRQGEIGQTLYVVLSGSVESRQVPRDGRGTARIATLGPGDYFGESGALEPAHSVSTVVVKDRCQLLVLPQVQLVALMRDAPELAIAIAREASVLARGAQVPRESPEVNQLRAQMMMYADDLKHVYEDERARAGELRESMMDTIRVLINAIESVDPRQVGHGGRVARYTQLLAREIGWSDERAVQAAVGGLIHDIGRVGLSADLARKTGPLSRTEMVETRQHPELGARLLRGIKSLEPLLPYVLYHHEYFDGTGYPYRLRGAEIPIEGRLVAVGDEFDEHVMANDMAEAASMENAIRDVRRLAGNRLDPELVTAFTRLYREGRLAPPS